MFSHDAAHIRVKGSDIGITCIYPLLVPSHLHLNRIPLAPSSNLRIDTFFVVETFSPLLLIQEELLLAKEWPLSAGKLPHVGLSRKSVVTCNCQACYYIGVYWAIKFQVIFRYGFHAVGNV